MKYFTFLFLIILGACSAEPIKFKAETPHVYTVDTLVKTHSNKYALLLEGGNSTCNAQQVIAFTDLDAISISTSDLYIKHDMEQTANLALSKGYVIIHANSASDANQALEKLAEFSDDSTKLLVAMSGEGDQDGFIFNLVHMDSGANLVSPDKKLRPKDFFQNLSQVKGSKALVIHACQSGCFVDAAQKIQNFRGVVIAACPVGYATTNCEATQTSAIYAGFLGLYHDDPTIIKNLATSKISAGSWFENFRHKISDIGAGGLSISYDPVIYSTADFLF